MGWLSLTVEIAGQQCLIVGGGEVACHKAEQLLSAEATVCMVSPDFSPEAAELAGKHPDRLELRQSKYTGVDLSRYSFVIVATDITAVNRQVASDAKEAGVWVNVVDDPIACTVQMPAVVDRGDLHIAVSTAGQSPALAKKLRQELEELYPIWYAVFIRATGRLRKWLKENCPEISRRRLILNRIADTSFRESTSALSDEEELFEQMLSFAKSMMDEEV